MLNSWRSIRLYLSAWVILLVQVVFCVDTQHGQPIVTASYSPIRLASTATAAAKDKSCLLSPALLQLGVGHLRTNLSACASNMADQMIWSDNWGNLLSIYWEARARKMLSGEDFVGSKDFRDWMAFLPQEVQAEPKMKDSTNFLKGLCSTCRTEFTHECAGAWTKIRSLVQKETHAALDQMDASLKKTSGDEAKQAFGVSLQEVSAKIPTDHVLVHMRLEFAHSQVLWPSRSYFQGKVTPDTKKVTVLHMPYTTEQLNRSVGHIHQSYAPEIQSSIGVVLQGYKTMFEDLCKPDCVVELATGSQRDDFAKLARHEGPVICSGSSYCLWAAYANIHGPTYFMGNKPWAHGERPPIEGGQGAGFKWVDKPVLPSLEINWFKNLTAKQVVDWVNEN